VIKTIPDGVAAELVSALLVVQRTGATVDLELTCDPRGILRLRTVAVRGASSQSLVPVDKGVTIKGT